MSMPHINLRCNKCGHTGGTLPLYRPLVYHFRGHDVRISKTLGYCLDCDNFRAIENFDSVEEVLTEIDELSDKLLSPTNRITAFFLAPFRTSRQRETIRELQTKAYYLGIAALRLGDERCLTCLSSNFTRFNGKMNLQYGMGGVFEGQSLTGFKHPDCGGEFIAEGSEIRFNLRRESIYFDIDGSKLSQRQD